MQLKRKIQILVDLVMTVMLPLLMAYSLIGEAFHEWIGMAMFVMFILHHEMNLRFIASLAKGKYTPNRIFLTAIDFLLLVDMLALMVSAVMLSRHVFAFLPITGGAELARTIHLFSSYWGFVLMSMHIGLHFHTMTGMVRKKISESNRVFKIISRVVCPTISAYGLYVFLSRKILDYMLLKTHFVFFDFSESILFFIFNYVSMMVLFGAIGYYVAKLLRRIDKTRKKSGGYI